MFYKKKIEPQKDPFFYSRGDLPQIRNNGILYIAYCILWMGRGWGRRLLPSTLPTSGEGDAGAPAGVRPSTNCLTSNIWLYSQL